MPAQVHKLSYGADGEVTLELESEQVVADCHVAVEPLDDPAAATAAALIDPCGFPPLSSACVPGDHAVIAVDGDVPQAAAILAAIVDSLRQGAGDITVEVVCATEAMAQRLAPTATSRGVSVHCHDPADDQSLTYVAAAKDGQPIYFNRLLQEADVAIPVGAIRPDESLGYVGVAGSLFPAFSDTRTQARFRAPKSAQRDAHRRRRREEAAEAAWLLGIQFTVQVIAGHRDTVLQVLAGDVNEVEQLGRRMCDSMWLFNPPQRATLVVAAIDGDEDQQTWENFGRALHAARQAADDNADIVVCTDLTCPPGPALRQLAGVAADAELARDLKRRRTPDAMPASVLHDTLQSSRVYLLSRLRVDQVEDLGLGHVANHEELGRLIRQHSTCTLIPSAHRAMVKF